MVPFTKINYLAYVFWFPDLRESKPTIREPILLIFKERSHSNVSRKLSKSHHFLYFFTDQTKNQSSSMSSNLPHVTIFLKKLILPIFVQQLTLLLSFTRNYPASLQPRSIPARGTLEPRTLRIISRPPGRPLKFISLRWWQSFRHSFLIVGLTVFSVIWMGLIHGDHRDDKSLRTRRIKKKIWLHLNFVSAGLQLHVVGALKKQPLKFFNGKNMK